MEEKEEISCEEKIASSGIIYDMELENTHCPQGVFTLIEYGRMWYDRFLPIREGIKCDLKIGGNLINIQKVATMAIGNIPLEVLYHSQDADCESAIGLINTLKRLHPEKMNDLSNEEALNLQVTVIWCQVA